MSTTILPIVGVTMTAVVQSKAESITFTAEDGREWIMEHYQDCCENVEIEDVCGSLSDLVGSPITQAEETVDLTAGGSDSATWTFYRIGTAKGGVVIRWIGTSNGYYSESVSFSPVKGAKP